MKGVEPPRLAASDPKSNMSTNSITSAILNTKSKRHLILQLLTLKADANLGNFFLSQTLFSVFIEFIFYLADIYTKINLLKGNKLNSRLLFVNIYPIFVGRVLFYLRGFKISI